MSNWVPSMAAIQAFCDNKPGTAWAVRTGTSQAPQGGWGKRKSRKSRKSKVGRGIRRVKKGQGKKK